MGSWATSIHVRTDDTDAVIEAARAYLLTEHRPSERAPEPAPAYMPSGPLRAIRVAEARDGWVSVLDSELMGAAVLSMELAARLGCHSLVVSVSDSDSWDYQLCLGEELIDAFDSGIDDASAEAIFDEMQADLEDAGVEGMEGLATLFGAGDAVGMQRMLADTARVLDERLLAAMPPQLREIRSRMEGGETVTPEEMQRYMSWAQEEMRRMMGDPHDLLQQLMGGAAGDAPADTEALSWADEEGWDEEFEEGEGPAETPHSDEELADHAEQLRPLLAPGVTADDVVAALRTQSVFAEDDLRRFLPLLGIAPIWADLSYRYIEEFSPQELAEHGVRVAAHLTFERIAEGGEPGPGLRMI